MQLQDDDGDYSFPTLWFHSLSSQPLSQPKVLSLEDGEGERERHRAEGLNELKAHRWAAAAAGEGGN